MDTLIFNVDSRFRNTSLYTQSSNFIYDLPYDIKNIIGVKISSIEFENNSYLIDSSIGNNTITIDSETITLDSASYTAETLVVELKSIISSISAINHIKTTIDTNTGKIKFESSTATNFTLTLDTITNYKSLGQILGFSNTSYTGSSSYTGDNVVSVLSHNYYFLKINDLGQVFNGNRKYICKMLVTTNKFEANFDGQDSYVTKDVILNQPINLRRLDIKIEDLYGTIVTMNGGELSFTIELKVIRNSTLKKFKNLTFHSPELKKLILYDKMLEYFDKRLKTGNSHFENKGLLTVYQKLTNLK